MFSTKSLRLFAFFSSLEEALKEEEEGIYLEETDQRHLLIGVKTRAENEDLGQPFILSHLAVFSVRAALTDL